jgi:hypothetical protein
LKSLITEGSAIACPYRDAENGWRAGLRNPVRLETALMTPRLAAMAALCREIALPVSVLALICVSGFAGIHSIGAAPIVDRLAPTLTADVRSADRPLPTAPRIADAVIAASTMPDTAEEAAAKPASQVSEPIVAAALPDSSATPRPETAPDQAAETSMASLETGDANRAAGSTELHDACSVADTCTDRYLWVLYQRAPKEDAVKTQEQRKVAVRKKGKLVTVTKSFTKLVDEDFAWKDPKAAEKAGMPLVDYVIGGVDRDFKAKLSTMLHAAEEAGLAPGITSAFRDDYRQSIASGLKAADNRSYHGGSLRGGYGHGLAADLVSVKGATRAERLTSTQTLWQWIDAHGKEFGIGRPYLNRDPPHVAPIDGKEWADHRPHAKT